MPGRGVGEVRALLALGPRWEGLGGRADAVPRPWGAGSWGPCFLLPQAGRGPAQALWGRLCPSSHVPEEPAGPAGRRATGTPRHVTRPLQEQSRLCWPLRRDTVQAPGRPGSHACRCYCCSVFGTGPSAPLFPHPPHVGATGLRAFSAELSRNPPRRSRTSKGAIHHRGAVFTSQNEEMKTRKTNAAPLPLPLPTPSPPRTAIPFTGILQPNRLM